jgi:putative spermidine/putrescine transport system ATP-binding protein
MADRGTRVELQQLTKSYGRQVALAPTNLTIEPGEFFSLIGPSGSGKSTLLGCVAGFIAPTAGRILVGGEDVVAMPPYKRNIGMVFQNYALFPHMSVFENIAFPLRLRRMPAVEIKSRVSRMLETIRLVDFGTRSPQQLSGGQQQRVALGRAAVYDPRLLLMDEPLGALDKNLREEMQYEIRQFHAALGTTIVYVTHDQDEAATMSDRIGIMKDGSIVQTGRPRALYDSPRNAFVAGFLGEANLLPVREIKPNGHGSFRVRAGDGLDLIAASAPPAGSALTLCIRPEALAIEAEGASEPSPETVIPARVDDVVFTAGTVRYRVSTADGARLVVRRPLQRQGREIEPGAAVRLVYAPSDIQIIDRE